MDNSIHYLYTRGKGACDDPVGLALKCEVFTSIVVSSFVFFFFLRDNFIFYRVTSGKVRDFVKNCKNSNIEKFFS